LQEHALLAGRGCGYWAAERMAAQGEGSPAAGQPMRLRRLRCHLREAAGGEAENDGLCAEGCAILSALDGIRFGLFPNNDCLPNIPSLLKDDLDGRGRFFAFVRRERKACFANRIVEMQRRVAQITEAQQNLEGGARAREGGRRGKKEDLIFANLLLIIRFLRLNFFNSILIVVLFVDSNFIRFFVIHY
jgi:hypothetical protein